MKKITLLDLSILLYHLGLSARHQNIGYNDADTSLLTLLGQLNKTIEISDVQMESLLYASNLMNEEEEWEHPMGLDFNTWLAKVLGPGVSFNRVYNLLEGKKNESR